MCAVDRQRPGVAAGLAVILPAGAAGMLLLLAMGRLCLDLDWGRSVHQLGPITIRVAAPREQVFGLMRAPYVGRIAGRRWVRPQWERIVGEHLETLRANAERQASPLS